MGLDQTQYSTHSYVVMLHLPLLTIHVLLNSAHAQVLRSMWCSLGAAFEHGIAFLCSSIVADLSCRQGVTATNDCLCSEQQLSCMLVRSAELSSLGLTATQTKHCRYSCGRLCYLPAKVDCGAAHLQATVLPPQLHERVHGAYTGHL